MLDAPDRCSRIHGRTALHSHRINLTANRIRRIPRYKRSLPSFEPAIRASTSPWRRATNSRTGILQRNFISVPLGTQGIARSSHDHRPNSVDRDLDLETVAERVSPVDASLYIRGTEQRGFLACWKNTLCSSSANIILGAGCFSRPGTTRGFRRVFVLSRPDDLRPPSPCHFNNNNNNSCPICLSEYVSGYLCLGRNRAWCGNGGSLLAKSRGNWMGGVPNGTSFRKLADDQSFIIVAQWINLSGLDKSI